MGELGRAHTCTHAYMHVYTRERPHTRLRAHIYTRTCTLRTCTLRTCTLRTCTLRTCIHPHRGVQVPASERPHACSPAFFLYFILFSLFLKNFLHFFIFNMFLIGSFSDFYAFLIKKYEIFLAQLLLFVKNRCTFAGPKQTKPRLTLGTILSLVNRSLTNCLLRGLKIRRTFAADLFFRPKTVCLTKH